MKKGAIARGIYHCCASCGTMGHTRDDIITDLKFAIERIDSCLDKDEPISERIINVLLHPEIGYTLNCTEHVRAHE